MAVVAQQGALPNASARYPCVDSASAFIRTTCGCSMSLVCAMMAVRGGAHCRTARWEVEELGRPC
eukprot:4263259-Alexandrium_andersonii.AAC.1